MFKRQLILKLFLILVIILSFSSTLLIGYAYWDTVVDTQEENVSIGDWGIPITTAQEFYNFAIRNNSLSEDRYYLFNDIDFTGFTWNYDSSNYNIVFRGTLDGNGKTLSNLTLTHNSSSSSYNCFGIFPMIEGASIHNLTFLNINLVLGSSSLNGSFITAGLIAGNAIGGANTISNITIINAGIRGTSSAGTGGLIGSVTASSTTVNIDNIKATNMKVFSKNSNVGGLVGYISTSGAQVNVSDVDLQGEVFSYPSSSYTGGIIGSIINGGKTNIQRAIIQMTSRNTLETDGAYYNRYSQKYLGGFIGNNSSASSNVLITDAFFTGSLFTQANNIRYYIGTAVGNSGGAETLSRAYYALVEFRSSSGSIIYTPDRTPRGVMATLVSASSLPIPSWWDTFATQFYLANDLWSQDSSGRLILSR
ncbi:MAG: hypothetical protein KJ971_04090 [Firmicutes bacterium]|nr:hypothetical protein [Bacillota bacterium]